MADFYAMHLYDCVCFWLYKPAKRINCCKIPSLIIPNELFEELILQYDGHCFDDKPVSIHTTHIPKYFIEQILFKMYEPMVD